MADERDVRCITCGAVIRSRPITIVTRAGEKEKPRIWTVPVYVCTVEACLERAGGTWTEHLENRSGHG